MILERTAAYLSEALAYVFHEGRKVLQSSLVEREFPLSDLGGRRDSVGVVFNALLVAGGAGPGEHNNGDKGFIILLD